MKDILDLLGRVLIAFIFLFHAYDLVAYFGANKELLLDYGITWRQDLLLSGAIALLILGATLVLVGYRVGLGVILLLLYWIPLTFVVHSFWNDAPEFVREESMEFMKNLAIMGGLLIIWVNGSGRYSVKRLFATTRVRS